MTDDHHDDDGAVFDQALDAIKLTFNIDNDKDAIALAVAGLHKAITDGVRVQDNTGYAKEMSRMAFWAASVALGCRAKVEVGADGEVKFLPSDGPIPEAPTLYFAKPGIALEAAAPPAGTTIQ